MPYDDPILKQFENYYLSHKPSERERAENWAIAIGLQKVDGLTPSAHLISVAKRHIEGKISSEKAVQLVDQTRTIAVFAIKYLRSMRIAATNELFAGNSWYFRNALVRANYDNPLKGIARDFEPLERFFGNLMLGEQNELKSRYLLVGLTEGDKCKLRELSEGETAKDGLKSGKKKAVRKSGKKTVDRLWELLKTQPHLTLAGMVAALGITRSTIQKHLSNLRKAGRLRRIGPDKGGHWEVIG